MNFIENQQWRYATKKMDVNKKVNPTDLNFLLESMRLTASSYGLQPYKILCITDESIREKLKEVSWNQSQVTDCSHLFVFANITNFGDQHIDAYIKNVSETRQKSIDELEGYATFMKSKINALTLQEKNIWTAKQCYLAMGNLLNAAAELKIDVTPMEGFEPKKVNEILGLNEQNLHATLLAAVGYRSEEDVTQHFAKVRKSTEELFEML